MGWVLLPVPWGWFVPVGGGAPPKFLSTPLLGLGGVSSPKLGIECCVLMPENKPRGCFGAEKASTVVGFSRQKNPED